MSNHPIFWDHMLMIHLLKKKKKEKVKKQKLNLAGLNWVSSNCLIARAPMHTVSSCERRWNGRRLAVWKYFLHRHRPDYSRMKFRNMKSPRHAQLIHGSPAAFAPLSCLGRTQKQCRSKGELMRNVATRF